MTESTNPLGDIAELLTTLDDPAIQSLHDQAKAELSKRRTARALDIFIELSKLCEVMGCEEGEDNSVCQGMWSRTNRFIGVRVTIPFRVGLKIRNLVYWAGTLASLDKNASECSFTFRTNASVRQIQVVFTVQGLESVPGLYQVSAEADFVHPTITTILAAHRYEKEEVGPLRVDDVDTVAFPDSADGSLAAFAALAALAPNAADGAFAVVVPAADDNEMARVVPAADDEPF
jgi:hypothetical protein